MSSTPSDSDSDESGFSSPTPCSEEFSSTSPATSSELELMFSGAFSAEEFLQRVNSVWPAPSSEMVISTSAETRKAALAIVEARGASLRRVSRFFMEALSQAQSRTNTYKNACTTAGTLPEDVLLEIFGWAALTVHKRRSDVAINVSRTCRRWRTIALISPSLWTTFQLHKLSEHEADLHRSRSGGLPVTVLLTDSSMPRSTVPWHTTRYGQDEQVARLTFCKSLIGRLRTLQLDLHESDKVPLWLQREAAPHLETLDISYDSHTDAHPESSLELGSLLKDGAPELRSLSLKSVYAPWSSLARATKLSKLTMVFPSPHMLASVRSMKATAILKFLRSCRELTELSLGCRVALVDLPVLPRDVIELKLLKRLKLELTVSDAAFLLHCIATRKHKLTELKLVCWIDQRPSFQGCSLLLPSDPRCLPCLTRLRTLSVDVPAQRIEGQVADDTLSIHFINPYEWLHVPGAAKSATMMTFVSIMKYYPMPDLKALTIVDRRGSSIAEDLVSFLRHSPTLVELTLDGCNSQVFDDLAIHCSSSTPLCPSLTCVALQNMIITSASLTQFVRSLFHDPKYSMRTMVLRPTRESRTQPIATIHFENLVRGKLRTFSIQEQVYLAKEGTAQRAFSD
ncbi:hypothetical protein EIP91_006949 [Steccherinum ochraceum]|uniref:F-box domain-containing protein n=1 Tax=Steccherinum ochraceum TaxID=92696 RepID=A0A4R0RAP0_9APHY|nr:hypothetical protein EIP91_006949 [Steccherinum ochraceum]